MPETPIGLNEAELTEYLDGLSDQDIDELFLAARAIRDDQEQEPLKYFTPHTGQIGFNNSNKKLLFGTGETGPGRRIWAVSGPCVFSRDTTLAGRVQM